MAKAPYASATWRRVRKLVLERDRYTCRIGLPGCTTRATQVDHIVKLEDGGAWYDPLNLRAACKACNVARENIERARPASTPKHAGPSRQW